LSKSNSKSFKWLTVLKDSLRELIEIESALKIRLNWLRDFAKSYMRLTSSIFKWIGYLISDSFYTYLKLKCNLFILLTFHLPFSKHKYFKIIIFQNFSYLIWLNFIKWGFGVLGGIPTQNPKTPNPKTPFNKI